MQAYPPIHDGHDGWPLTTDNLGTGCVRAPDLPKRVTTCAYEFPSYGLTPAEHSALCTDSGKTNAVGQLRHAIQNDRCSDCLQCATDCMAHM